MPAAARSHRRDALAACSEAIDRVRSGSIDSADDRLTHDAAVRRDAEPPLEGERALLDQHR